MNSPPDVSIIGYQMIIHNAKCRTWLWVHVIVVTHIAIPWPYKANSTRALGVMIMCSCAYINKGYIRTMTWCHDLHDALVVYVLRSFASVTPNCQQWGHLKLSPHYKRRLDLGLLTRSTQYQTRVIHLRTPRLRSWKFSPAFSHAAKWDCRTPLSRSSQLIPVFSSFQHDSG